MSKEKSKIEVKKIYYINVGDNQFVATHDRDKALALWTTLSDHFFRIADATSRYMSKYSLSNRSGEETFLYPDDISEEEGIVLHSSKLLMYPDKVSAEIAQEAFNKLKKIGEGEEQEQASEDEKF